jgi:hypothetical protein
MNVEKLFSLKLCVKAELHIVNRKNHFDRVAVIVSTSWHKVICVLSSPYNQRGFKVIANFVKLIDTGSPRWRPLNLYYFSIIRDPTRDVHTRTELQMTYSFCFKPAN